MTNETVTQGAESRMLAFGDGDVHLLRGGDGPPLLFLHAFGAGGMWSAAHARIAEHYEVFAPDHPGMGRSEPLAEVDDIHDLVYHYLALLDRLGLDRVVLVGESFGGWIAAELAVHSPERVDKLVLLGAPGLRLPGHTPLDVFLATPQELAAALFHDPSIAAQIFPAEPTVDDIVRSYAEASAFARYAFAPFLNDPKLERRLGRVTAPTLVAWADDDRVVPLAHGERYVERIRDARLQIIPECGHALSAERPDAVAEAIVSFVKS